MTSPMLPMPAIDAAALEAALASCPTPTRLFACTTPDDLRAAAAFSTMHHALAVIPERLFPAVNDVLGVHVSPAPVVVQGTNPLVAQRLQEAVAPNGAWALPLEHAGAITIEDRLLPLALLPGGQVAVARMVGKTGSLLLVAGTLAAGFLAAGGQEFLAIELHAAMADTSESGTAGSHPPVPLVNAGTGWDLSLLPVDAGSVNDPRLVAAAGHAGRLLPAAVHDALIDFADAGTPAGALLIRGLPVGQLPPTPERPSMARKPDLVSEFALLTAARILGQPVGYQPEHGGDLVQNVSPVRQAAHRQVSTSSRVELEFHTEAAFHPFRPRFLLLLALRGDPLAATTLCSVHAILPKLTPVERRILSQPRFTTGIDESYAGPGSTARSLPRPVLWGTPAGPRLWLDNDLMLGTDPQAQQALERIAELARTVGTSVVLQAGDLLVVDNDVAVHGRSPFTPRFDGTDRWLQRSMVVPDLGAVAADLDGRIVATQFVSS